MKIRKVFLFIIIFVCIVLVYPIVSYYLQYFRLIEHMPTLPSQTFIQVFLSGPLLSILGILLIVRFKKKILGLLFLAGGLFWLWGIFYELVTKN